MDFLEIECVKKLSGAVKISGAKNAALPLIAASILAKNDVKLRNLPSVTDIKTLIKILTMLGAESLETSPNEATINTKNISNLKVIYDMVRKMRASILLLGPLLSRFGKCQVSLPGGCAIGARPVDLHIKAMQKMGAEISIANGYITATAPNGLKGAQIIFDKITVTGTENVLMAAALARGKTTILNPAKEPEVIQLCEVLAQSGVEISGAGSDEIHITGTDGELLKMQEICIIPDRIEAGTYLCAGAITNAQIQVQDVAPKHLEAVLNKLREIGFEIDEVANPPTLAEKIPKDSPALAEGARGRVSLSQDLVNLTLKPAIKRNAFEISTSEYPGFPTDMQAQFMALATQCEGVSIIEERLFENRFMHINELHRLGANIALMGNIAKISGRTELKGADVMATDLRASSALILAALVSQGKTKIHRIYHLDRGYENIEAKLSSLGVKIARGRE
ncbi:UDP-N-acetylglucosamine 1-carboxyvinyltransferase [Helicobacter sp. 23-1044]